MNERELDQEARGLAYAPSGRLYGYRTWSVSGGLLRSGFWTRWPLEDAARALCPQGFLWAGHRAPGEGHSCGIYAWRYPHPKPAVQPGWLGDRYGRNSVRGVVQLWGKVIVHGAGYRAEFARIAAVEDSELAETVAAAYDVPVIPTLLDWNTR